MDTALGMNALSIYYTHYGRDETSIRKRRWCASALCKKIGGYTPMRFSTARQFFQIVPTLFDDMPTPFGHHTFRRIARMCNRNHIYMGEIMDMGSVFYKADITLIDAILIDRDDSCTAHQRTRGKYNLQTTFHPDLFLQK